MTVAVDCYPRHGGHLFSIHRGVVRSFLSSTHVQSADVRCHVQILTIISDPAIINVLVVQPQIDGLFRTGFQIDTIEEYFVGNCSVLP